MQMKIQARYSLFLAILFISFQSKAQYYNSAFGKNGALLKTALHNIIQGHTVGTYADLWADYYSTDNKGGNILWDIYSDIPGGTPAYTYSLGSGQCGTYNSEGDCYNREHIWPQNFFNGNTPMYTDLQQVYPTDGWVNGAHGNLPYGKVNSSPMITQNGSKKGGSLSYPGYSGDVFEPIDSFKGDIARIYFYMTTRYEAEDAGWLNWKMANGAVLTSDAITLLLSWHHLDPVSQKEVDRNNAAYAIQNNRNPFIDYPQFADCIWGSTDCTSLAVKDITVNDQVNIYPNPSKGRIYIETKDQIKLLSYMMYNFSGQIMLKGNLNANEIELSNVPTGNYMLILNTSAGVAKKIILKEN